MTTPHEQRRIRMRNDYKEMQNIQGAIIKWRSITGTAPYIDVYELTVNIRTIIGPRPNYRDTHILRVTLPSNYPTVAPLIVMQTNPQPYHPNWYKDNRWCHGTWNISEGLGHYIIRMIRTLQFDVEITQPDSSANTDAKSWYLANRNRGWFPCDRQVLPDPTNSKKFEFPKASKKTFRIE